MKYDGDLSRQDVQVLAAYAVHADCVCEFGVGASTMVLCQSLPAAATFVTCDTDPKWNELVVHKIRGLGWVAKPSGDRSRLLGWGGSPVTSPRCDVRFVQLRGDPIEVNPEFMGYPDLVFVDGRQRDRIYFARAAWPRLRVGGHMIFHDSRRLGDNENVLTIIRENLYEIDTVIFHERSSNMTVIRKKLAEPWTNWHEAEKAECDFVAVERGNRANV